MHIISKKRLREFWSEFPESELALRAWYRTVKHVHWKKFADIRNTFNSVDVYRRFHVFNVSGNRYRIIAAIHFNTQRVFILHVLTHEEYDTDRWKADCECD